MNRVRVLKLPCGTPYSNKRGWYFDLEAMTLWKRSERIEDNKVRALEEIPNQHIANDELKYHDQDYQKQQIDQGEEQ